MESITCYCNGTDNYGTYSFGITKEDYERLCLKYVNSNDTYSALKSFVGKENGKTYYSIKTKDFYPKEPLHIHEVNRLKGKKVDIKIKSSTYSFKPKGALDEVRGCSFILTSIDERPKLQLDLFGPPKPVRTC